MVRSNGAANSGGVTLMDAHNQWASRPDDQRFETLADLRAKVAGRRARSRAVDIDTGRLHVSVETGGRLVLNSAISPCEPSHWAFGQLAGEVGAPASYLRGLSPELVAANLNYGLSKHERGAAKFMTLAPETEADPFATLQAVTSPKYGRIWDADCVDAVGRLVDASGGKWRNPVACPRGNYSSNVAEARPAGLYASDHDVFMFYVDGGDLLDIGGRAKLHRGFIVSNSETGARTFQLMTFYFNTVCGNHFIWGARDINKLAIRHTSGGPYRFDSEAAPLLMSYATASAKPEEDAVGKAITWALPKEEADLKALAARFKITGTELREAVATAKREDGQCATLWDLIQGLTAYARDFAHMDTRLDLEKRAGSLMALVS